MGMLLQILGLIFLVILVYIAFRVAVLVGKAAMILYAVKKMVAQAGTGFGPARVSLIEVSGARWDDGDAAALAAPLPGLGFEPVGFFDLDLMGETRLQAWFHPDKGAYAVVFRNPRAGAWADVFTKYADGSSLTYTGAAHGGREPERPGHEIHALPGHPPEELFRRMLAAHPDRPTRKLDRADFRADFERSYAEEVPWRDGREAFSPDRINPAAALAGVMSGRFTEDQARQIRESLAVQMYRVVVRELRRAYEVKPGASADGDRLVFVWDSMNGDAFPLLLPSWKGTADFDRLKTGMVDDDGEDAGRRAFAAENAAIPENLRYVKVGEVETLVGGPESLLADVYAPPRGGPVSEPGREP